MTKKRIISKAKTYGFNPYLDQIDTINQIMKEIGAPTESVLLRKLVDEALAARRKKNKSLPLIEEPENESDTSLHTIETLLMRLLRQEDTLLRILDVCLALLQDVLAQSYATRQIAWESLVIPRLEAKGLKGDELEQRFILQADQGKDYAYRLAVLIKDSQKPT
jgi:hypothetical protein